MPQISLQILRKATAKSVILGRKNLKKVLRNPGGTETFYNAYSKLFSVHQFSSITCWLSRVPSWRGGALVSTEMRKCCHTTSVGREETRQKVGVARGAWHPVESTAGAPPTRSHIWEGYHLSLSSCFNDVFPWLKQWLSNCMRHDLFIHVYFTFKLVVKNKGWLHSMPPFELIQWSVPPHQRK